MGKKDAEKAGGDLRWQEGTVNAAGGGEALSSQVRVPLPVLPESPASYAWTTEITRGGCLP